MMSRKFTKKQREKIREARKELQIIIVRSRQICFDYVVKRITRPKVCFGSGLERECLPTKGPAMSSVMRRVVAEPRECPGPFENSFGEDFISKKPLSRVGYSGLANKTTRTFPLLENKNPPIGSYTLEPVKKIRRSPKPFGVGAVKPDDFKFVTPSSATYKMQKYDWPVKEAFGTKRIIVPAYRIICSPKNNAKCFICNQTPVGDYWRCFKKNKDMCRPCMNKEMNKVQYKCNEIMTQEKLRRRKELEQFCKARYCGFYHAHNGTSAAVRLLTKSDLTRKIRIENYLSKFNL